MGLPSLLDSPHSLVRILSAAAKASPPAMGEQYHSPVVKLGFNSNVFVNTALLSVYSKSHDFCSAQQLFDKMPHRNVVTWSTLIYCQSQSQVPFLAVNTFADMLVLGISPSPSSILSAIVACSRLEHRGIGTMLHSISFKHGVCCNLEVGTALVNMYSKCCDVCDARRVFDEMHERNAITWASLVTGYLLGQRHCDAMLLAREMRHLGVELNEVAYNCLLSSFSKNKDLVHGKQVHCLVILDGRNSDPYIVVSLLSMYSKCQSREDFLKLTNAVSTRNQILCNSIIAGFSHLGEGWEVLERFAKMRKESIDMDSFTFASVLRAIGIRFNLEEGRQVHAMILKTGHDSNVCIENGLVSMYAKCGAIDDSRQAFSSMNEPNLVSWNSLLSGYTQHGYGKEVVELFDQMRGIGVRPDRTTFLSVLNACSHVGLVKRGLEIFSMMRHSDPPIVAELEHYACVVDLLGRAGHLDEAEYFIKCMPINPCVSIYKSLLSACQVHGNVEIAKNAGERLFELCPDDPATPVLLSNVFAADGRWDNAAELRKILQLIGMRKKPALTWIEDRISC